MQSSNRLIGIDLSYTISLLGLITFIYSFSINKFAIEEGVLSHSWNILFLDFFPGLFFFLNGLTISLTMRDRKISSRKMLSYMTKRGTLMVLIGLCVCIYWPMNVFIATGFMYLAAPFLVQWNSSILRIVFALSIFIAHGLLFIHVPSSINYKIPEIHGGGIIDLTGFLFFNGYFSIFPWFLFFIGGMLFGRSEIRVRGWLPPTSMLGFVLIFAGFALQYILKKQDTTYLDLRRFDNPFLNFRLLMPAFVFVSIGVIILLVNAGNYLFKVIDLPKIVRWASIISSMKYSILFFQLIICSSIIILTPGAFFAKTPVLIGFTIFITFFTIYLAFFWNKKISNKGPLEWMFKRVSGSAKK
jgi:hypothetical protein